MKRLIVLTIFALSPLSIAAHADTAVRFNGSAMQRMFLTIYPQLGALSIEDQALVMSCLSDFRTMYGTITPQNYALCTQPDW